MSRRNQGRIRSMTDTSLNGSESSSPSKSNEKESLVSSNSSRRSEPHDQDEAQGDHLPRAAQVILHHPTLSVTAAFSIGFGLGMLVTVALARPHKSWLERHHLPETLHDLTGGFRRLPGMIAHHMPGSLT